MAGYGARKTLETGGGLFLLKQSQPSVPDTQTAQNRQRNRSVNLRCGVDVEYLERLRRDAGLFAANLARILGIPIEELRDYINYNKICPVSFAQNWELTILYLKN